MADLVFKSSLTVEQIDDNFKDIDLFSKIMEGLQEVLAYERAEPHVGISTHEVVSQD